MKRPEASVNNAPGAGVAGSFFCCSLILPALTCTGLNSCFVTDLCATFQVELLLAHGLTETPRSKMRASSFLLLASAR